MQVPHFGFLRLTMLYLLVNAATSSMIGVDQNTDIRISKSWAGGILTPTLASARKERELLRPRGHWHRLGKKPAPL